MVTEHIAPCKDLLINPHAHDKFEGSDGDAISIVLPIVMSEAAIRLSSLKSIPDVPGQIPAQTT